MNSDLDPGSLCKPHGLAHVIEVRPVEPACDVCRIHIVDKFLVRSERVGTKTLAHVAIQGHTAHEERHRRRRPRQGRLPRV